MNEEKYCYVGELTYVVYPKNYVFEEIYFQIFRLRLDSGETVSCKGTCENFSTGTRIKVTSKYPISENSYGKTIEFDFAERDLDSKLGRRKFVEFVCGKKTAELLIDYYGGIEQLIEVLERNDIELLTKVRGIGKKRSTAIINKFSTNKSTNMLLKEFSKYGLTYTEIKSVLKEIKVDPVGKIKKNPYILTNKCNISFHKVDTFALKLGFSADNPDRYSTAFISSVRKELNSGNIYTPQEQLFESTFRILAIPEKNFFGSKDILIKTVKALINEKILHFENNNIFFEYVFREKEILKDFVLRSKSSSAIYDIDFDIEDAIKGFERIKTQEFGFPYILGVEQKEAVKNSVSHQISIITGGPGTGKTTVLECVTYIFERFIRIDQSDIALMAPTAKAAIRASESTGLSGTTVHKALAVDPQSMQSEHSKTKFSFNANNKLYYRLVIEDEVSMMDYSLMASLVEAIKTNTRVVFVGDINQLPPVSYGYTLRDFIDSGMPTVQLNEVHRQKGDSTIISLSQMIKENRLIVPKENDFAFADLKDTDQILKIFLRGYNALKKRSDLNGVNPLDEIVILTPQNKKTFGTENLNNLIQEAILPSTNEFVSQNGFKFQVGSKVLQIKNNNDIGVANGQTGYVTAINVFDKTIVVKFDGNMYIYNSEMLCDLKLGYAITVHKSQGSEWKYVIEIISNTSKMNTKPLVYTGITRAKEKLIILGDESTFLDCPNKLGQERRSYIL